MPKDLLASKSSGMDDLKDKNVASTLKRRNTLGPKVQIRWND